MEDSLFPRARDLILEGLPTIKGIPTIKQQFVTNMNNIAMRGPAYNNAAPVSTLNLVEQTSTDPNRKIAVIQLTGYQLEEFIEKSLSERITRGDRQAIFLLGQYYFEERKYLLAKSFFQRAWTEHQDLQAAYQLGVIHFDGLEVPQDREKGVDFMLKVTQMGSTFNHPFSRSIFYGACYNIGRAFFQGLGVRRNEAKALEWWLQAADKGNPKASVLAQTALGLFYSNETTVAQPDLAKAFFWHTEACGNGSIESQGVIGVMYLHGVHVKQDWQAAFDTLYAASSRGNVYAQANLCYFYYVRKMYTKCTHLGFKLMTLTDKDMLAISYRSQCLLSFIRKGIAIAAFLLARCLQRGVGVQQDVAAAKTHFSKSFEFDHGICGRFQSMVAQDQL